MNAFTILDNKFMNQPSAPTASPLPLAGLRVLDLTAVLMGPVATQVLGEMGADVIKIEAPDGDMVRLIGPVRNAGMGPVFLNANRNKRSAALDLKNADAKAALLELVKSADVFIYNVRPQAIARLGLGYEALAAINPRLVYVGVFGYAQDGPYAAKPAYDDLIQGASGLASLFQMRDGSAPAYVPNALADRITGLTAVNALLAALLEREKSGLGQRVDVPMFETMVNFTLGDHMGGLSFAPALDAGGYARQLAPGRRPYRTQDGFVSALIYTDKQWRSFYQLLGREAEFAHDERLKSLATRTVHVHALYAEVEAILATRSTAEWLDVLNQADIPAMPVHDLQSLLSDPHLQATGHFQAEHHPSEGELLALRPAARWSRTPIANTRPAPRLGEHTREVLAEAGLSASAIDALIVQGAAKAASPL